MKDLLWKNKTLLFLVILCLPLLFINVKGTHDWGDDFAQYFIQARNLVENKPQTDNGLVFDIKETQFQSAIKAYPVEFPLMLAGVWKIHGYSIKAFSVMISILMIGFAVLIFLYLKKTLSALLSFVLVLAVIYNPVILDFKKQILSDIPFSLFLLLPILLFQAKDKKALWNIFTGILFGWALSVRGIGIVLFVAVPIWMIICFVFKNKNIQNTTHRDSVLVLISGVITYIFLNSILYQISSNSFFSFYAQAFNEEKIMTMIHDNLFYYYDVLKYFFGQGEGFWLYVSSVTKYFMIYSFLFGMVISWKRKFAFDDVVFVLYVIVILIYPYQAGGFRFLIPIIPFFLKYAGVGIMKALELVKLPKAEIITTCIIILVFLQNIQGIQNILLYQNTVEQGPQSPSSSNALEFIKNHLPDSAVIVFAKPRALSFYTGKKSGCISRKISVEEMHEAFQRMNAHYILLSTTIDELYDPKLMEYVSLYKNELKAIWQNEDFIVYNDNQSSLSP